MTTRTARSRKASGETVVPAETDAVPIPETETTAPEPMFGPPATLRDPFQTPETTGETTPGTTGDDGDESGSPERGKWSPASTDLAKRRAHVTAAREVLSATLRAVSGLANARFAVSEDDPSWLMDDQQVDDIAAPVARIIVRRLPFPEGGTSASDITDGITAVVGLVSYVIGSLGMRAEMRRRARPDAPAFPDEPETEQYDSTAPASSAPAVPSFPLPFPVPGPLVGPAGPA